MMNNNLVANGRRNSFFRGLQILKSLTMMQLKEKLDLSFVGNFRKSLFKIIYLLIEFAVITVICYFVLFFVKFMGIFSLVNDIPVSVMAIIFFIMLIFSVISSTVGLVTALYFSKDNQMLLTLPSTPSLVFLSKLAVYYIYEIKKNFMFIIPLFISYGIVKGLTFLYYPWLLFLFIFLSALPVTIAALLSIPSMYVYQFVKKYKWLQYSVIFLAILAVVVAVLYLIGLIPENINLIDSWGTTFWVIQSGLSWFTKKFSLIYAFTSLIVGKTVGLKNYVFTAKTLPNFAIMIGVLLGLIALCFILAKPLFYKMASKPFEYTKKENVKALENKTHGKFATAVYKEFLIGMRNNHFISLFCVLVVVMPIAIELLNTIYSAMNTRYLGTQMTISFNVLIMALIMLSTNINLASAFSRDGSTAYLNKVQPTNYGPLLFSKLLGNLIIAFVGITVTVVVFSNYSSLSVMNNILLGASVYLLYVFHMFFSAESDIMNPQYEQYATFNAQSNNPNENISAIIMFLSSAIFCIIALLLSVENVSIAWIKMFIIILCLTTFKIYSFFLKIKIFYKEKQ